MLGTEIWAGDHVGGGGHAINCIGVPGRKPYELLDFFEGREFFDLTPDLGVENLSVPEKIALVLDRLERLDPERAKRYRDSAQEILKTAKILPNMALPEIADHFILAIPEGCRIQQFAIQSHYLRRREFVFFLLKKEIWDQVGNDDRAGIILHETVYADAIALGHTNSRSARRFLEHFLSREIEKMSREDYEKLVLEMGFKSKGDSHE